MEGVGFLSEESVPLGRAEDAISRPLMVPMKMVPLGVRNAQFSVATWSCPTVLIILPPPFSFHHRGMLAMPPSVPAQMLPCGSQAML